MTHINISLCQFVLEMYLFTVVLFQQEMFRPHRQSSGLTRTDQKGMPTAYVVVEISVPYKFCIVTNSNSGAPGGAVG
jgi:hypothetical protein